VFLLNIVGKELAQLNRIAGENGMDVQSFARLLFLKGFRAHTSGNLTGFPYRQQQKKTLDDLIRQHWKTKGDAEIGRLIEPNASRGSVHRRRLELNLKKVSGRKNNSEIRKLIEQNEFEQMVVHDGYTMTEYMKFKNIHCSRERLRQIVEDMGLKHSPENRAPEWFVMRRARQLGNMNLANREWMTEKVANAVSLTGLAAELGISDYDLNPSIKFFKLGGRFHRKTRETVPLVCANPACRKSFVRLKRWVDARHKNAGEEAPVFCSPKCARKCNTGRPKRNAS
jgi:hypothetical protein